VIARPRENSQIAAQEILNVDLGKIETQPNLAAAIQSNHSFAWLPLAEHAKIFP
jgi:hypothetical protein